EVLEGPVGFSIPQVPESSALVPFPAIHLSEVWERAIALRLRVGKLHQDKVPVILDLNRNLGNFRGVIVWRNVPNRRVGGHHGRPNGDLYLVLDVTEHVVDLVGGVLGSNPSTVLENRPITSSSDDNPILIRNRLVHNPLDQVILDEDLRVVIDSRVNDSNHATVACGEEAPVRPRTLDIAGIPDLNSPTVVLVVGEGTSIDSVSVTRRSDFPSVNSRHAIGQVIDLELVRRLGVCGVGV